MSEEACVAEAKLAVIRSILKGWMDNYQNQFGYLDRRYAEKAEVLIFSLWDVVKEEKK